jgi:hypothetical protein
LLLAISAAAARVIDEFARLAGAYQLGAKCTRFPCGDNTDDRSVIGTTTTAPAPERRRCAIAGRLALSALLLGALVCAHMNPNQLGAFVQAEAARFGGLLKNSHVSRATP